MASDAPAAALRILVVEDDALLRRSLGRLLEASGHRVDFAARGREALALALTEPPDVMVLDIGLPDLSGHDVCRALREQADRHVPVLMLTARGELKDKLAGFDAGADDYLPKPFDGEELVARCQALSARHRLGRRHLLCIGPLRIDRQRHEAMIDQTPLNLVGLPWRLLLAIAEAHPRAITRSELVEQLWGDDVPGSDPLRTHLSTLRRALEAAGANTLLRSIHGVGYRLDAEA